MMHKREYGSAVKDQAPRGLRTTYCGKFVTPLESSTRWENVTCELCEAFGRMTKYKLKLTKGKKLGPPDQ
jgi:hypothetical protein